MALALLVPDDVISLIRYLCQHTCRSNRV